MQFFKHLSTMRHDPKVKRLVRRHKANGYAVYNWILESITEGIETESPLPILEDNITDLAYELGIPEYEIEEIVSFCVNNGLLQIISDSGIVYCVKIYKYLNTSQTRSDRLRQMIKEVSGKNGNNLLFADIKDNIERAILLEYKDLNSIPILSETVCDNNDRKEEDIEEEIDIEEEKKKEKINKKESSDFSPFQPYIKPSNFEDKGISNNPLQQAIIHWNSKTNLSESRYTCLDMPRLHEILPKFNVYSLEEILKAIDNLDSIYLDIEGKKPTCFHNFFANHSIDLWVDSANPLEAYSKPFKESNMTETEKKALLRYYLKNDKDCEDWNTLHEFMDSDYFRDYLERIGNNDE